MLKPNLFEVLVRFNNPANNNLIDILKFKISKVSIDGDYVHLGVLLDTDFPISKIVDINGLRIQLYDTKEAAHENGVLLDSAVEYQGMQCNLAWISVGDSELLATYKLKLL